MAEDEEWDLCGPADPPDPFGAGDGDGGEEEEGDLLQSILELTDDAALAALLDDGGAASTETPEQPGQEVPLGDLVTAALRESRAPRRPTAKAKAAAAEAFPPAPRITSTTYHKRGQTSRPGRKWSDEEVDRLHDVLRQYGPNFTLLETFFPGRTRAEIKAKYTREDKSNPGFMTELLRKRRRIDVALYDEWKARSASAVAEAAERELDAMHVAVDEAELLAALGDGPPSPAPMEDAGDWDTAAADPGGSVPAAPAAPGEAIATAPLSLSRGGDEDADEDEDEEYFGADLFGAGDDRPAGLGAAAWGAGDDVEYYD